ncbi:hypothetical protein G6F42_012579 [Rhizopus arrhizus]|nr:hypothetical protein G6F42_012579 [Rhizopus arrhizus]
MRYKSAGFPVDFASDENETRPGVFIFPNIDLDAIQQKLSFISINNDGIVKKAKTKPAFRISMALQKKLNKIGYNETLIILKEFTVTSSSASAAPLVASSQDNIPPVNDYY